MDRRGISPLRALDPSVEMTAGATAAPGPDVGAVFKPRCPGAESRQGCRSYKNRRPHPGRSGFQAAMLEGGVNAKAQHAGEGGLLADRRGIPPLGGPAGRVRDNHEASRVGPGREKRLQHEVGLPIAVASITRYDIFPVQSPCDVIAVHSEAGPSPDMPVEQCRLQQHSNVGYPECTKEVLMVRNGLMILFAGMLVAGFLGCPAPEQKADEPVIDEQPTEQVITEDSTAQPVETPAEQPAGEKPEGGS